MSRLHNAIDLLGKLVAFDTTSKNSNLGLIHFVRDYLAQYGIESTLFHDETGEKANLLATIGPKDVPGIALSGHTDVVPALEKSWVSPAFELTERDGKLFGRGSADMKGFSACALAMVPELVIRDLAIPFRLCLSYDEEVGCLGVGSMVDHLAALKTPPRLAVIGEPTEMKVINGQKGKFSMRVSVTGTAGHSSFAHRHVNAIEYAARARAKAVLDGIKEKIISTLDAEMKAKEAETGFEWEEIFSYPGMGDCTDAEAFALVRNIIPEVSGKVSYGSEGGIFEKQGNIPSIICGPGSIKQAHKANEFIEISQIEECLEFLEKLSDQAVAA